MWTWGECKAWRQTRTIGQTPDPPANAPVFTSRHGGALTRYGIYKLVRRHTANLKATANGGPPRRISPHVLRHTTAVHLLEAGVEINVIRGWLGHVSLDTTHRYAEINMRSKEAALEACAPPVAVSAAFPRRPVWRDDDALLNWLAAL